jgi:hypothetical protein
VTPDDAALRTFGTTEPPAPRRVLQAGALRAVLEGDALRHIAWRGVEVLRGIAYLLRDTNWGTPAARLAALEIEDAPDAFRLRFESHVVIGEATLVIRARIEGRADGTLRFDATATPDRAIDTCRCGFVVLHPADAAGLDLEVRHTDGTVERTRFPTVISPSQPVFDIRALTCRPAPGLLVTCRMEADLPQDPAGRFEMEDQRNWSDASFKTYVGSLLDPWPYRLEAGLARAQQVEVTIREEAPALPAPALAEAPAILGFGAAGGPALPEIGIGVPQGAAMVEEAAAERLARLRPGWLVVSLELDVGGQAAQLAAAAALAARCGARVQLEVVLPAVAPIDHELADAALLCAEAGLAPAAVLACPRALLRSFQPSDIWPAAPSPGACAAAARAAFPGARIGAGMVTYFTELNRCRPAGGGFDFVGHATAPIVHAADDISVMETLEALPHIAHSVRAIWPGLGHRIGPSSLAMRSNPYGAALRPNPDRRRVALAGEDPRQQGLFAAAWTLGYAAALAPEGIEMLALHATHGPSTALADAPFAQEAASALPVFHALQWLARAAGRRRVPVQGAPRGLAALACAEGAGTELALANLTPAPLRVRLQGAWQGRVLDGRGLFPMPAGDSMAAGLELAPYACAFLRG